MRHLIALAILGLVAVDSAAAQSGDGERRSRRKGCAECSQDSAVRVMHLQRMRNRDHNDRFAALARELTRVRSRLHDREELSDGERQRLQARARQLESQLAGIGVRFGLELSEEVLRGLPPAMADANRAVEAALAEAGVAGVHAFTAERSQLPGWIGITLTAKSSFETRGDDVYWKFFDYPRIVSVEPSSPADRAGIRQGDILLAYDGQDVRREIAMNRVLQPGRLVRVRLRGQRDDEVREVPVRVAPSRVLWRRLGSDASVSVRASPRAPRAPGEVWTVDPQQPAAAGPGTPTPMPRIAIARVMGVAGARMESISPGLGEAIGVERGILVISVAPGVPARESGLSDGDVILRADGQDVGSVQDLQRLMAAADEKAIRLDVSRKGKVRQVTLRW